MRAAEGRKLVREIVAPVVGETISGADFQFRSATLTFARRSNGTHQFIHLGPDFTPTYAPGALVVLQPTLRVEFQSLAAYLVRSNDEGTGTSVVQPLAYGGRHKQWEIGEPTVAEWVAMELAAEIQRRGVPLLDALLSPAALMYAHSVSDPRVMWHDQTYAAVIAAYALAGRLQEARQIASKRFLGHGFAMMFPRVAALLQA